MGSDKYLYLCSKYHYCYEVVVLYYKIDPWKSYFTDKLKTKKNQICSSKIPKRNCTVVVIDNWFI